MGAVFFQVINWNTFIRFKRGRNLGCFPRRAGALGDTRGALAGALGGDGVTQRARPAVPAGAG